MLILNTGHVTIGFSLANEKHFSYQNYESIHLEGRSIIGDHYLINKKKSSFIYKAVNKCTGFAISKRKIHDKIFPKYYQIYTILKSETYKHYKDVIYRYVYDHRLKQM